jgi:hypothetical protein
VVNATKVAILGWFWVERMSSLAFFWSVAHGLAVYSISKDIAYRCCCAFVPYFLFGFILILTSTCAVGHFLKFTHLIFIFIGVHECFAFQRWLCVSAKTTCAVCAVGFFSIA